MLASREKQQQTAKLNNISQSFVVRAFARDKGPDASATGTIKVSKVKRVKSVTLHPDVDKPERLDEIPVHVVGPLPPESSNRQDNNDELARNAVGKLQAFILSHDLL